MALNSQKLKKTTVWNKTLNSHSSITVLVWCHCCKRNST